MLKDFKDRLPKERVDDITLLATHGEWGLAYEILCTNISDFNISLSRELYNRLGDYGSSIGADPYYQNILKQLVVD